MYRILVADNDLLMREAIKTMIKQAEGFEITASICSGEEAVEYCKTYGTDIVFMEVMMPGMTGVEAAQKIYEIDPRITVYLMSTYTSFSFARQVLGLNVRDYISKPVSTRAVRDILENYKIEKEGNSLNYLFMLREIVDSCDFKRVYYELRDCATRIFRDSEGSREQLQSMLSYIGQNLIGGYFDFENPTEARELLFPIYESTKPAEIFVEVWLMRLMIDVFNQNTCSKYPVMEKVFKYINEHYREAIGLEDVVASCNISQGYLSRIFKKQYDISVMEYLHMRKLMLAKFYFHFSTYTVIDIAYNLGYNESSYFGKVFKKYEGMTVQEYKKLCASNGEVFAGNCDDYLDLLGIGSKI